MIGENDGVDIVEKVIDTLHVEPLRTSNGIDVLGKGATASVERILRDVISTTLVVFLQLSPVHEIREGF